jgi:hypothetical protein
MAPLLAAALWLASTAGAQASTEAPSGYVVKVESGSVFLDFGAASGAAAGQVFVVYTEGAELFHPKTHKSLGRVQNKVADGTLTEVLDTYSTGKLTASAQEAAPGMRARLGTLPASASPTQPMATTQTPTTAGRQPRWKSPALDFSITGMAISDFKGDGTLQAAVSESKKIYLYAYPFTKEDKPLAVFTPPGINVKIVNVEAANLDGDNDSEIFISMYNQTFERFETYILHFDGKELKKVQELPGVTRSYQDATGKSILAVQQLSEDSTFPFANIYPLSFQDGKYSSGKPAVVPFKKRVDWVFDFTTANLDGQDPAVLYLTSTNHLRVQFQKGSPWRSPEPYGQTPIRVSWQGRLLDFHPPMLVGYDAQKKAAVYLAHNISKLGSLSEPFGFFERGEIYRKSWNGVALEDDWKADIGGYCAGLTLITPRGKAEELAVAVVSSSGRSSIWTYDP